MRLVDHHIDHHLRAGRRLGRAISAILIVATTLALGFGLTGCGDADERDSDEPTVTARTYQIKTGEPGEPLQRVDGVVTVDDRLGFSTNINRIHGLRVTDGEPPLIIDGWQEFDSGGTYIRSRKLRIERIKEPDGAKVVQVNVSLDSPLALKSLRGVTRDEFVPGPLLQDSIGNSYWASGYKLTNLTGDKKIELNIDRGDQFKNLNDLPRLSRNKPQELILYFFVNEGVTLTSFSYGGGQPKYTFNLPVERR